MAGNWQPLIANLAVVALFISAWVHGQFVFADRPRRWRNVAFGTVMGLGAVASMLLSIQIEGSLFDLRYSLIAIASFFGGPLAGLIAMAIASVYRAAVGGDVAGAAIATIAASGVVGVVVSRITRRRVPGLWAIAILALAVASVTMAPGLIIARSASGALQLPVGAMNALATALSAFFIMRQRSVERERDLLRAAFVQSQDIRYVKAVDGRYVAVNETMAQTLGLRSAAAIIGRTDMDVLAGVGMEAADVMDDDRRVLETGEGYCEREEMFGNTEGPFAWYSSSKLPLRDGDGKIIGLAGTTRDITPRKRLERELLESRNQLSYVLAEIADGVAMFDHNGTLVYCNDRYRSYFELTAGVRQPGGSIREILRAVAATGEQRGIPEDAHEAWVDGVAATLLETGEQEIQLFNDRWLHLRTRPTADGAALVVVSDVTRIKEAETALKSVAEQLRLLATTDGLTGLTNRRAFDEALEAEIARSRRNGEPLSLLLADVDKFKAYNDLYGHQLGDEVLKAVGRCLAATMKRPTDVAARYGGEEFVAILPGTGEDGAFFIADEFRERLHLLGVEHAGSDKGMLTASVGIATFTERDAGMNATELVRRADEALYTAKGAGRDRVTGWRAKHEIAPMRVRT